MTDYFIISPFEVMTADEFTASKEKLAAAGRKVLAVVFNCANYEDFKRKYFGEWSNQPTTTTTN